jgi:hypothetical protein
VVRSLREHWLELRQAWLRIRRQDARPGRPDRQALILRTESVRDSERAQEELEETLQELRVLDVYCLDPVRGLALVPFVHGDEPAWFVFELFAAQELVAWRYHDDPLETRRPLTETSALATSIGASP